MKEKTLNFSEREGLKPLPDAYQLEELAYEVRKVIAEYAFRGIDRPMGVVEYETMLTKAIPEALKSSLPTVEEIEAELSPSPSDNPPA